MLQKAILQNKSAAFWQTLNQALAWVKDFGIYQFHLDKVSDDLFEGISEDFKEAESGHRCPKYPVDKRRRGKSG